MTKNKFLYLVGAFSAVSLAFVVNHFISSLSPLFVSLLVGLFVGNIFTLSKETKGATPLLSKNGMRIGIALLGLQITFQNFIDIGVKGFVTILFIVALTFTLTRFVGLKLGFTPG